MNDFQPSASSAGHSPTRRVLDFWFGELDDDGQANEEHRQRWWKKDPDFDQLIRTDFGWLLTSLLVEEEPPWVKGPLDLLAAIIVLDQFSRNMYRDTESMFAADQVARRLTYQFIALGYDEKVPLSMRVFSYMPLMHSERLVDQDRCVELFSKLVDDLQGEAKELISYNQKFAVAHRDIVARFGRFPHRNALLGRASTEAELSFLKEPGSSF